MLVSLLALLRQNDRLALLKVFEFAFEVSVRNDLTGCQDGQMGETDLLGVVFLVVRTADAENFGAACLLVK